jgi:hypothetical protein
MKPTHYLSRYYTDAGQQKVGTARWVCTCRRRCESQSLLTELFQFVTVSESQKKWNYSKETQ